MNLSRAARRSFLLVKVEDGSEDVVCRFKAREVEKDSEVVWLVTGRKCESESRRSYSAICC